MIETPVVLYILSAAVALLGFVLTKTYLFAVELTKIRGELERSKNDRNGLGDKIRQTESKLFYYAFITCPEDKRVIVADALTRRMN